MTVTLFFLAACACISGLFMFMRPEAAIELQRRFYARINWRMEPISMSKELRNTRIMGAILAAVSAAVFALLLRQGINPA